MFSLCVVGIYVGWALPIGDAGPNEEEYGLWLSAKEAGLAPLLGTAFAAVDWVVDAVVVNCCCCCCETEEEFEPLLFSDFSLFNPNPLAILLAADIFLSFFASLTVWAGSSWVCCGTWSSSVVVWLFVEPLSVAWPVVLPLWLWFELTWFWKDLRDVFPLWKTLLSPWPKPASLALPSLPSSKTLWEKYKQKNQLRTCK